MIAEMVTSVQAFLDANGVAANVVGDFPERDKQINQGPGGGQRVVIFYGDESGDCGTLDAPNENNEGEPRYLLEDQAKFTLYIWGYDADNKNNRAAQVDAARTLRDWTIRAFVDAAPGYQLLWGGTRRTKDVERQFGVELLVSVTVRTNVDDVESVVVKPAGKVTPITPTGVEP